LERVPDTISNDGVLRKRLTSNWNTSLFVSKHRARLTAVEKMDLFAGLLRSQQYVIIAGRSKFTFADEVDASHCTYVQVDSDGILYMWNDTRERMTAAAALLQTFVVHDFKTLSTYARYLKCGFSAPGCLHHCLNKVAGVALPAAMGPVAAADVRAKLDVYSITLLDGDKRFGNAQAPTADMTFVVIDNHLHQVHSLPSRLPDLSPILEWAKPLNGDVSEDDRSTQSSVTRPEPLPLVSVGQAQVHFLTQGSETGDYGTYSYAQSAPKRSRKSRFNNIARCNYRPCLGRLRLMLALGMFVLVITSVLSGVFAHLASNLQDVYASKVNPAVELENQLRHRQSGADTHDNGLVTTAKQLEEERERQQREFVRFCADNPLACSNQSVGTKFSALITLAFGHTPKSMVKGMKVAVTEGVNYVKETYEAGDRQRVGRALSGLLSKDLHAMTKMATLRETERVARQSTLVGKIFMVLKQFNAFKCMDHYRLWERRRAVVNYFTRNGCSRAAFEDAIGSVLNFDMSNYYIPTTGSCFLKSVHYLTGSGDDWDDYSDVGVRGVVGPNLVQLTAKKYKLTIVDVKDKKIYASGSLATKRLHNVILIYKGHAMPVLTMIRPTWPVRTVDSFQGYLAGTMPTLKELREMRTSIMTFDSVDSYVSAVAEFFVHQLTAVICILQRVAEVVPRLSDRARASRFAPDMLWFDTSDTTDLKRLHDSGIGVVTDGRDFMRVYRKNGSVCEIKTEKRWVFGSVDISYIYEMDTLQYCSVDTLIDLTEYNWSDVRIILYDGVPGCGKTRSIAHKAVLGVDLILTNTRLTLPYLDPNGHSREYVRTYGSFLSDASIEADNVYMDEALMVHPGVIYLCAYLSSAKTVHCYGDTMQLKFVGHVAAHKLMYRDIRASEVRRMNVTHRCPIEITDILSQFYPEIITDSSLLGTISIEQLYPGDFDGLPTSQPLMTFTTHEKQMLTSVGYRAHTIAECQGETFTNVCLVRLLVQDMAIYQTSSILVVALSRHTTSIVYYTVDPTDTVSKLLSKARPDVPFSDEQRTYDIVHRGTVAVDTDSMMVEKDFSLVQSASGPFVANVLSKMKYDCNVPETVRVRVYEASLEIECNEPETVPLRRVQAAIDSCYHRLDMPMLLYRLDPLNLRVPSNLIVDKEKLYFSKSKTTKYLQPKLCTPQVPRNDAVATYFVAAILKRNLDPPVLHKLRPMSLIMDIVDTFFVTFIDDVKFNAESGTTVYYNQMWFDRWYADRTSDQKLMFDGVAENSGRSDRFEVHVKPDLKVPLDNSHNRAVIAGQVIAAHSAVDTGCYSPIFQAFSEKLSACLKEQFLINSQLSVMDMSEAFTYLLRNAYEFRVLETDFSKFDKSQDHVALEVFIEILRRFGVPTYVLEEWRDCHELTVLFDRHFGLNQPVAYQRKSGDASTFVGNTLVTMAALAFAYPLSTAICGIFGGDDSLVIFPKYVDIEDRSQDIMDTFNLFTKIEMYENSMYFASKFLLNVEGMWLFVPDPIKGIVRLGRHDMFCKQHIEEYARSFKDNMQFLISGAVRDALTVAVKDRYQKKCVSIVDVDIIIEFLAGLVTGVYSFLELYEGDVALFARPLPYRYM